MLQFCLWQAHWIDDQGRKNKQESAFITKTHPKSWNSLPSLPCEQARSMQDCP